MIGGFGVGMFGGARAQLGLILFLPLPMLALLAVGLSVHLRLVSLALLAVVLAAGTYCRRFGPPGFMGGMLAFMGAFLGFFIQDYVTLGQFGWLAAEVAVGMAGLIAVHFALFRPRPEAALRRMQRSYGARARALASEVAEVYEATSRSAESEADHREERRLQRQLPRLNEAALLIDAQLSIPQAVPAGWSGGALHQRLFDAEVALSNVARFAQALARRPLPAAHGDAAAASQAGGQPTRSYVRSASLFERVADTLPGQSLASRLHLALRDLQLLDGALAEAARWAGVEVSDLDTVHRSATALTGKWPCRLPVSSGMLRGPRSGHDPMPLRPLFSFASNASSGNRVPCSHRREGGPRLLGTGPGPGRPLP
jgi:hypothetical protein